MDSLEKESPPGQAGQDSSARQSGDSSPKNASPATSEQILDAALGYVERGWHIFPVHGIGKDDQCTCGDPECPDAGKHPATQNGFNDATDDAVQVREWFDGEERNIGVRTGEVSGLTVIDIDIGQGKKGAETWQSLIREQGEPKTSIAQTGSGGLHAYFQYNSALNTSSNTLGPGVDCRNDDGYVVAPPSRHRSGGAYEWAKIDDLAPLPKFLTHKPSKKPARKKGTTFSLSEVNAMLSFIDPGDRDTWRKVGIVLGREFNRSDEAWEAYIEWSDGWDGKKGRNHDEIMREAFYELSVDEGELSIASIVHWAREGGGVGGLVRPPGEPLPNARIFLERRYSGERDLLIYKGGQFYCWDGTCWPLLDEDTLRANLYLEFEHAKYSTEDDLKNFAPNKNKMANLAEALQAVCNWPRSIDPPSWLDERELPSPADIVACRNGLVHLPDRSLLEHTPHFFQHHALPFDFDPEAPVPERWMRFLDEIFGDDDESKNALQEMFGYLVSADTRYQKMFFLVGPKRSGKGTIARVLGGLVGRENIAAPTLSSLSTNFGLQVLIGKPVAIIADARFQAKQSAIVTERLLSISGEDEQTVDRKHRDAWTGKLPSRILIMSNELPRLADSSGALASRFVLIQLTRSFYGNEDPGLTADLLLELPGILNWALDGLERLHERGRFVQPQSGRQAIEALEELSSPVLAFFRERCTANTGASVAVDELYREWGDWCRLNGHASGSRQHFGKALNAVVPGLNTIRPTNEEGVRYRAYEGIGLREDADF